MTERVVMIGCIWSLICGLLALGVAVCATLFLYRLSDALPDKTRYRATAGAIAGLIIAPGLIAFALCDLNIWNWVGVFDADLYLAHINLLKSL